MDLNQLAIFIRLIDCGSVTKAANALRMPKSRVSRRLAALEKALGISLVHRTTRQFCPTEAGRALYERCRGHVYELDTAAKTIGDRVGAVAGTLRITATPDIGTSLLGPLLGELMTRHPELKIDLRLEYGVVDLVRDGLDAAIRIGKLKDASFKMRPLGHITFVVVASPSYLLTAPRLSTIADLSRHPAIDFDAAKSSRPEWRLRKVGAGSTKGPPKDQLVPLTWRGRSNNTKFVLDLVLAGQGVACLPDFLCRDYFARGELQRVLPRYATKPWPVQLVWPAHRESAKLRAFLDLATLRLIPYFSGS